MDKEIGACWESMSLLYSSTANNILEGVYQQSRTFLKYWKALFLKIQALHWAITEQNKVKDKVVKILSSLILKNMAFNFQTNQINVLPVHASPCQKSRDKSHTISPIMATAPESESQENEQLAMVIRESLRNTPQVSTSLNSAQSVFPICHQTPAPILENYPAPLTAPFPMPMSMSMYPNLPYMQPYFHRVETPSLCVPHFSVNTALPLLHSESIETSTKDNDLAYSV